MKIQLKMTVANYDARNQVGDNTWEIIDVSISFFFSELGVFFLTDYIYKEKRERKKKRSFSFDIFPRSSSFPTRIILWCSPKCVVVSLTACALLLRRLAVLPCSPVPCVSLLARRLIFFFFPYSLYFLLSFFFFLLLFHQSTVRTL